MNTVQTAQIIQIQNLKQQRLPKVQPLVYSCCQHNQQTTKQLGMRQSHLISSIQIKPINKRMIIHPISTLAIIQMTDFCYWDAKSKEDLIIIIINQSITATIGVTALLRMPLILKQYRRKSERIRTLMLVHILVMLWSLTQSIVNFYSIAIFLFKLTPEETAQDMIEYSHTFAVICAFPGFIVQTLFVTICYKYCSNILKQQDVAAFSKYSYKFKKTLFIYCLVRVTLRVIIIFCIGLSSNEDVGTFSTIEFILLIVDSGIINVFLVGSALMFICRLKSQQLSQLKLEYWMMVSCSFSRICIDMVFLLAINAHSDEHNLCVSSFQNHMSYTFLYNLFGNLIMHFTPIAVILKIYQYDLPQTNRLSLLGVEDKNQDRVPTIAQLRQTQ